MSKSRVKIPMNDSQAVMNLVTNIREQHMADGDASPLKLLNWNELHVLIDETASIVAQADRLKNEKLRLFNLRKKKIEKLCNFIRNSRDILAGVNDADMRELSRWGFEVFAKPAAPRHEPTTPAAQ